MSQGLAFDRLIHGADIGAVGVAKGDNGNFIIA